LPAIADANEFAAGPALDARVIVEVLGYAIAEASDTIGDALFRHDPHVVFRAAGGWFSRADWQGRFSPSTDWRAAGIVVDRLMQLGFGVALYPGEQGSYAHVVIKAPRAWFERAHALDPLLQWEDLDTEGFSVSSDAIPSLPLALCRAALNAVQGP